MRKTWFISAAAVVLLTLPICAGADEIWNETGDGPLSAVAGAPTVVTLVSASDVVVGNGSLDWKYFTFTVPTGETVSSIFVDPGLGGAMTGDIWMFSNTASGPANCGQFLISAPGELLGAPFCAPSFAAGDYTIGLDVGITVPWTVTITSTVPVEIQTFTID